MLKNLKIAFILRLSVSRSLFLNELLVFFFWFVMKRPQGYWPALRWRFFYGLLLFRTPSVCRKSTLIGQ